MIFIRLARHVDQAVMAKRLRDQVMHALLAHVAERPSVGRPGVTHWVRIKEEGAVSVGAAPSLVRPLGRTGCIKPVGRTDFVDTLGLCAAL
jgi:hypothetical protein